MGACIVKILRPYHAVFLLLTLRGAVYIASWTRMSTRNAAPNPMAFKFEEATYILVLLCAAAREPSDLTPSRGPPVLTCRRHAQVHAAFCTLQCAGTATAGL